MNKKQKIAMWCGIIVSVFLLICGEEWSIWYRGNYHMLLFSLIATTLVTGGLIISFSGKKKN